MSATVNSPLIKSGTNSQAVTSNSTNSVNTINSLKSLMLEINAQSLTMLTPLFKHALSRHSKCASLSIIPLKEWDLTILFALAFFFY
jgi:hypothetical protein